EDRQAYIRENVADFGALIEAKTAQQAVTNAPSAKDLFERSSLRIGAIHHRAVRRRIFALNVAHALAHVLRLSPCIAGFVKNEIGTFTPRGGEFLANALGVLRHHRRGSVQDLLARAVILLDTKNLRVRKILGKAQNLA